MYALAESVGATVIGDEAYRWLAVPDGEPFAPPFFDLGARGISVGTLSKPFGLPGLRIGWIAGPPDLIQRVLGLRDYISLSPGKLNDALARLAHDAPRPIVARNRRIITANLATARAVDGRSRGVPVAGRRRAAACSRSSSTTCRSTRSRSPTSSRTDYSVMLAPGSAFGYEHHLRLGIGQRPDIFQAAWSRRGSASIKSEVRSSKFEVRLRQEG